MKTTKILLGLALVAAALTGCKEPKSDTIANLAYINEASATNLKIVAADNSGCNTFLVGRIAKVASSDVTFEWKSNAAYLEQYNKANGTDYKPLPAEYFTIGKTIDTVKVGTVATMPMNISIKSVADLPIEDKYAVVVSMSSIKGVAPLESSTNIVIGVDRVIETSVLYLHNAFIKSTFADALKQIGVENWTAEFLFKVDNVETNNQALFMMYPEEVYSRLGDQQLAKPNELQTKTQEIVPSTKFTFAKDKWYHVALVYTGATFSIVVDGKTDITVPPTTVNLTYAINEMQFGNGNTRAQVAEVRLWTVARTNAQLMDRKYTISPTTPGLLVYWKCNEGEGTTIKDYTGHGYDVNEINGRISWVKDVRFPDNK